MNPRRRPRATRRPLVVPPPPERAVGPDAIRAGYSAHKGAEHAGLVGRGCRTCVRYVSGLVTAAEAAAQPPTDPTP